MTYNGLISKNKINNSTFYSILCLALASLMIFFSNSIKAGVLSGLYFSFTTIIPTLFPFFILSDFWSSFFNVKRDSMAAKIFEKLFGINGSGASALVSGLVCGFPIGVKVAYELYRSKIISNDEFERLSGFANNPSAAFIISGVGAGIIGDAKLGIILYISIILSSITIGMIFKSKELSSINSNVIIRQNFNLSNSIKNAATSSIAVASYIIFFSGVISILKSMLSNELLLCIISSFLEVGNATKIAFSCQSADLHIRLILIAFSLGFSGLSVHMQAVMYFDQNRLSMKYIFMKLLQGILTSAYTYLFMLLMNLL